MCSVGDAPGLRITCLQSQNLFMTLMTGVITTENSQE